LSSSSQHSVRYLSDSPSSGSTPPIEPSPPPPPPPKKSLLEQYKQKREELIPRFKSYAVFALVGSACYIVFKSGLWVIEFMASINFADVGQVSYVAGLLSAGLLVLSFRIGARFLTLRPDVVTRQMLKKVCLNPQVEAEIGKQIRQIGFQASQQTNAAVRWRAEPGVTYYGWDRYIKYRNLHLFFQINGEKGQGLVSCEVEKDLKGNEITKILAVDVFETGSRIVVEGDPTRSLCSGFIKTPQTKQL